MPGQKLAERDRGLGAVTFVDHVRSDGLIARWESRHHR